MGGSSITSAANSARTVVLVGRTGNGKSATGNSILGEKAFKSTSSSAALTLTSELQRTLLEDGQILNVIDTPGLFDFSSEPEFVEKEIVRCIDMAKDGIHSILLVLTVRTRFSREEAAAVESMQKFFGSKITNYVVVVFTGGDDLEENGETLDDYLGSNCPEPLKEILEICGNRRVLFDNKTKDEFKKAEQLQQLLFLVNEVVKINGGRPYTDNLFIEFKEGDKLGDQTAEVKFLEGCTKQQMETTIGLEQELAEAQAALLRAEAGAREAHMKSKDEVHKLREDLVRAQRESKELRKQAESCSCAIL